MLSELSIVNFAIIDELAVSFAPGLTVLTGETGAGKSIIIDAIGLLVGGRGSSEWVRHGEKKAEIEGLFHYEDRPVLEQILEENGLPSQEGMIILKREISATGKSVCRINGKLVTLQLLKEVGAALVDIHGQHEHQALLAEEHHLHFLDLFGGSDIQPVRERYEADYASYREAKRAYERFQVNEVHSAHRVDLLQFQIKEIDEAKLTLGEEESLTDERNRLLHFERTYKAVGESYHALQSERGTLDLLRTIMNNLDHLEFRDAALQEMSDAVHNVFYTLEDVSFRLSSYYEGLEFQPHRLDEVEDRLATLKRLQKKYGVDVEDVIAYREKIGEELQALLNKDDHIEHLKRSLEEREEVLLRSGEALTKVRRAAAKQLIAALLEQFKSLHMERTQFDVVFQKLTVPNEQGYERVAFYISTNPGEPLKPLVKTASGGEISRVMLGLKAVYAKHMQMTSIIFDEVDTGVSGRVAQSMGEKIHEIAANSQVLCITHLPQVAALADQHLFIKKQLTDGRTSTVVQTLCDEDRTTEVARMISGQEVTQVSLHHAHELLEQRKKRVVSK
ncbi:MAG: DNA repair protein RecN [Bacilli bacterium]